MYYVEACNEFPGTSPVIAAASNAASFEEVVASHSLHCVQFDRHEIWTWSLQLQKHTRYRSTNWPVF